MKTKKILLWITAVVLSLASMVYQRMTGPSYAKNYEIVVDGEEYSFSLPRTNNGRQYDYPVTLDLPESFSAKMIWRLFPTENPWDTVRMTRDEEGHLYATLPLQPAAGKIEYHVELSHNGQPLDLHEKFNVVIRFRDDVPAWALLPHILMMVLSMVWACATILFVLFKLPYNRLLLQTLIIFFIGGLILGPIVQKFSFGSYWTGWPLGEDLTDNKTLFAWLIWLAAWLLRGKSYGKWIVLLAGIAMWAVYLIPHSMNGSELDPETGEVITGALFLLPGLARSLTRNKTMH